MHLDRCGLSGDQPDARRNLVDDDAHGDALGEANPGEGRIDVGELGIAALAFAVLDTSGDTLDMPMYLVGDTHEIHAGRISDMDGRKLGLFETALDAQRAAVDECKRRLSRRQVET
jgi:hypothetical protein